MNYIEKYITLMNNTTLIWYPFECVTLTRPDCSVLTHKIYMHSYVNRSLLFSIWALKCAVPGIEN